MLLDHDPEKQVGVIESVSLDGSARRLRATVRFGKGALAREAFDDVTDGIKANVSIGYSVQKMERKDKDTYVVKGYIHEAVCFFMMKDSRRGSVWRAFATTHNHY